jgi:hypothetical protein
MPITIGITESSYIQINSETLNPAGEKVIDAVYDGQNVSQTLPVPSTAYILCFDPTTKNFSVITLPDVEVSSTLKPIRIQGLA